MSARHARGTGEGLKVRSTSGKPKPCAEIVVHSGVKDSHARLWEATLVAFKCIFFANWSAVPPPFCFQHDRLFFLKRLLLRSGADRDGSETRVPS